LPVDWTFWQRMPMPAVYRLRFADPWSPVSISDEQLDRE
jgi:hypothetical protein